MESTVITICSQHTVLASGSEATRLQRCHVCCRFFLLVHSRWGQSRYEVAFESLQLFPYIYIPNLIRIRTDDRF